MGWRLDGLTTNSRPAGLPRIKSSPTTVGGWRCAALLTALMAVTIATSLPHAAEASPTPADAVRFAGPPANPLASGKNKLPTGTPGTPRPMPIPPPISPPRRAPVNDPPAVEDSTAEEASDYDDFNVDRYADDPEEVAMVGDAACTVWETPG